MRHIIFGMLGATAIITAIGFSVTTAAATTEVEAEVEVEVEVEVEEPEFGILFVADGVETTYYSCAGCHSERIIAQQGLTRDNWDDMLDWMIEDQGMGELDDLDRTEILDYLAAHYNEDRPNFPSN